MSDRRCPKPRVWLQVVAKAFLCILAVFCNAAFSAWDRLVSTSQPKNNQLAELERAAFLHHVAFRRANGALNCLNSYHQSCWRSRYRFLKRSAADSQVNEAGTIVSLLKNCNFQGFADTATSAFEVYNSMICGQLPGQIWRQNNECEHNVLDVHHCWIWKVVAWLLT